MCIVAGVSEEGCPFCDNVLGRQSRSAYDEPLVDRPTFLVIPALGMFLPGYLLMISRSHVGSFAHMGIDELGDIDLWRTRHMTHLSEEFGEYFCFEHGMGDAVRESTGACVSHAHLHLIPGSAAARLIRNELPWQPIGEYKEIASLRGQSYSYLGWRGCHYVVPEPVLPGQWVRRQTARAMHLQNWDWAVYAGDAELGETRRRLTRIWPAARPSTPWSGALPATASGTPLTRR